MELSRSLSRSPLSFSFSWNFVKDVGVQLLPQITLYNMRSILTIALVAFAGQAWASWQIFPQFNAWYPTLRPDLQYFIQHECSTAYEGYLRGRCPPSLPSQPRHFDPKTCKGEGASYLTNCLLKHMSEINKGWMAGAATVLGLMPTVLSLAASSTVSASMRLTTLHGVQEITNEHWRASVAIQYFALW